MEEEEFRKWLLRKKLTNQGTQLLCKCGQHLVWMDTLEGLISSYSQDLSPTGMAQLLTRASQKVIQQSNQILFNEMLSDFWTEDVQSRSNELWKTEFDENLRHFDSNEQAMTAILQGSVNMRFRKSADAPEGHTLKKLCVCLKTGKSFEEDTRAWCAVNPGRPPITGHCTRKGCSNRYSFTAEEREDLLLYWIEQTNRR